MPRAPDPLGASTVHVVSALELVTTVTVPPHGAPEEGREQSEGNACRAPP